MRPRLLTAGIVGTIVAAICCFTPALVVLFGAVGLSAWLGWIDVVLLPLLVACVALVIYGAPFGLHIVMLLPIGVILVAFVTGLGLILSTLNVFYRDFTHLIQLVVRVWLFLTPVVYAASAVPDRFRSFYRLNPLVGVFEGVRAVVIQGTAPEW